MMARRIDKTLVSIEDADRDASFTKPRDEWTVGEEQHPNVIAVLAQTRRQTLHGNLAAAFNGRVIDEDDAEG